MRTFWMKFTDGSESHCQGQYAGDAVQIAQALSGKQVVGADDEFKHRSDDNPNVQGLPYPASPMIWEFDHPVQGKTPHFCFGGEQCHGKSSCPRSRCCTD